MMEQRNGSAERLAEALRDLVTEAAIEAVEPLRAELVDMETRLQNRVNIMFGSLNEHMTMQSIDLHKTLGEHAKVREPE